MHIVIPFLGRTKNSYLDAGIQDYTTRLKRYASVDLPVLRNKTNAHDGQEKIKCLEANILLKKSGHYKKKKSIALDPGGRMVSSEQLAECISSWQDKGFETAFFYIGGHLGLHASIFEAADIQLSLSRLTFTHEMSRLLLLEQLYRACTICSGHTYHN
ncbi:MAG: hypothetical protein CSA32_01230 [Desulfobulbus propionicus]|nr:MAG: hypothetical protein CSA32_01230 [Desulfobulbus propionicus]